jgi:hypothetical protein
MSQAKKKRNNRASGCLGLVVALVVIVVIASAAGGSGTVTRADAIENVVNKIDSGPNWETQQDSNAVAGYLKWEQTDNGNDGGGGCAWVNGQNANAGFACYLQASAADGGANSYFSENKSGGDVHPISSGQYSRLVG